jgi:hypothetical protein
MKKWESEGTQEIEKLLKKFENHPLAKQIQADQAAETLTARQRAADAIKSIRADQAEAMPKLQAVAGEKEAKFLHAKSAMEAAGLAFNKARGELRAEGAEFDRQISILKNELYNSCDPALDDGIQYFKDRLDYLRSPGRIDSRGHAAERNIFSMTKKISVESNKGAVLGALDYCMAAIKALEVMKFEPELDSARIDALKNGIPTIDNYEGVEGEKPLEGSGNVDPLKLMKSESQTDWELGKLNEKFKKIMTRKAA